MARELVSNADLPVTLWKPVCRIQRADVGAFAAARTCRAILVSRVTKRAPVVTALTDAEHSSDRPLGFFSSGIGLHGRRARARTLAVCRMDRGRLRRVVARDAMERPGPG